MLRAATNASLLIRRLAASNSTSTAGQSLLNPAISPAVSSSPYQPNRAAPYSRTMCGYPSRQINPYRRRRGTTGIEATTCSWPPGLLGQIHSYRRRRRTTDIEATTCRWPPGFLGQIHPYRRRLPSRYGYDAFASDVESDDFDFDFHEWKRGFEKDLADKEEDEGKAKPDYDSDWYKC